MRKLFVALLLFIFVLGTFPIGVFAQESSGWVRLAILKRANIGTVILSSKSGTTFTVTKEGKSYSVLTDSNTKFRRRFWGTATFNEMQIGDTLNVAGKWTDEAKTTVQATLVRDVSIQKRQGVFFGTVQTVNSKGFVMQTVNRDNQTVTVGSSTNYENRKGEAIKFSDIKTGDRIRVRGLWNRQLNTIADIVKVKDFSLPSTPSAGN